MAVNDIYQLQAFQNFGNSIDRLENVYFYRQVSAVGSASSLADAFTANMLPDLLDIQTDTIKYNRLVVTNLFTVSDFATVTYDTATGRGSAGGVNADTLPPHDAVTFRLVRTSREIRNGFKRFAGVPELVQNRGVITEASYIALLETMRTTLAQNIGAPLSGEFDPVVVKRIKTVVPGQPPTYRLPTSAAEAVFSQFTDVLVSLEIRTQNTRKR